MKGVRENIIDILHERVGVCGHCGKRTCPSRKDWSILPANIPLNDAIAAIHGATEHETTKQSVCLCGHYHLDNEFCIICHCGAIDFKDGHQITPEEAKQRIEEAAVPKN
jgi:hypothetical protein